MPRTLQPIVVRGPAASLTPPSVPTAIVYVKRLWSDAWALKTDLLVESVVGRTAAGGTGQAELRREYGSVLRPFGTAFVGQAPIDLLGVWIKVELVVNDGRDLIWIGMIVSEVRDIYSSGSTRTGVQRWVAQDASIVLKKTHLGRSYWLQQKWDPILPATEIEWELRTIDWIPDVNAPDPDNNRLGNRSSTKYDGSYLYGGTDRWTRAEYVDYLLRRFVSNEDEPVQANRGPAWLLTGQRDILENATDVIPIRQGESLHDVLHRLISPQLGVDYAILPMPSGFELYCYALTAKEYSFGSVTLPRNPNTVSIDLSNFSPATSARVVRSIEHQYDRIDVQGARAILTTSLQPDLTGTSSDPDGPRTSVPPKFFKGWSATGGLEPLYRAGTGTPGDAAEQHDHARRSPFFDPVFQRFVAPFPVWRSGSVGHRRPFALVFENDGTPSIVNREDRRQQSVRRTLPVLGLYEGFDYSQFPVVDQNPVGTTPDLMRPVVFLYDRTDLRYVLADDVGVSVSVLNNEWGVQLSAGQPHLLAFNHFVGAAPTLIDPRYDYESMIATIAYELDVRLAVVHNASPLEKPAGSSIVLVRPESEYWLLDASAAIGLSLTDDRKLIQSPGQAEIRNDAGQLEAVMAGAIARYSEERARAEVVVQGLWPYAGVLGQILDVIEEAADTQFIDAPVTEIEWNFSNVTTIIRTGFAQ